LTGVFIFPPHLFSAATLPREIVDTWISAKIKQNHEYFTGRYDSDKKISICQSGMVHGEH